MLFIGICYASKQIVTYIKEARNVLLLKILDLFGYFQKAYLVDSTYKIIKHQKFASHTFNIKYLFL